MFLWRPNIDKLQQKGDIKGLIKALGSRDADMRRAAARALCEIGDERAVDALHHALQGEDQDARLDVVLGSGWAGNTLAVSVLIQALGDSRETVRDHAEEALRRIGAPSVDLLIQGLTQETTYTRRFAAKRLGQMRTTRAVEPLIQALRDEDKETRSTAAGALGEIGDARAVEPLIQALSDEDPNTRSSAAGALGAISDARAVEPLIRALSDEDRYTREAAVSALGNIQDPRAMEALGKVLHDGDKALRGTVVYTLGRIRDSRAQDLLIQALGDNDADVSKGAAMHMRELGTPAVELFTRALTHANTATRRAAVRELGEIASREEAGAVKPLIGALSDEDSEVRADTVWRLQLIKGEESTRALITALADSDPVVRGMAATALGAAEHRDPRSVGPLIRVIAQSDTTDSDAHWDWRDRASCRDGAIAVRSLQWILEWYGSSVPPEDLYAIQDLEKSWAVAYLDSGSCGNYPSYYEKSMTIDCTLLHQLARQELIRRGLKA